ncbi:hypothetical protein RND81_06G042100 [Saponaria officinalis]|uniref:BHLH domain-containing protein n=1 Tax=Saponaria officinalis TaxID=3572 RepID=A0AAW1K7J9_SAPOF
MEKLQGPFHPCLVGEDLDVGWLEEFVSNIGSNYKYEDSYSEEPYDSTPTSLLHSLPSLEDKMPLLQMLQGVEQPAPPTVPFMQEPNYYQFLMNLQHQKTIFNNEMIKSETFREEQVAQISNRQCDSNDESKRTCGRPKRSRVVKTTASSKTVAGVATRERRKRKRPTKVTKNKEEVETQRMTHIAVERNRRRQMNDHLNALRSLMPPSYVQRGDQASIIGGAIDFVKEMEQLLQSLQAQKRMRHESDDVSTTSSSSALIDNMFMTSPTSPLQFRNFSPNNNNEENHGNFTTDNINTNNHNNNDEFSAENRSALADIKVVVIQNHVNLKIQCQRRHGQLLKAILAFEQLRLTILHLNITSLHTLVHYSFNLKIEEDCKLGTADEVVRAVHHIFSLINLN